jgi:transposase
MANIRTLKAQLKQLDQTIALELQAIPQTLASIPGLGPVWTAGIIAEIGAITRFPDDDALAQFAGLTWSTYQSGQFQAEDTSLTQRGNTYPRYYLVEAANSVRMHCPEYRQYYAAKYAETPKHAHHRALVLTARKLVRLVDALLRSATLYQSPEQRQRPPNSLPHPPCPARQRRSKPA